MHYINDNYKKVPFTLDDWDNLPFDNIECISFSYTILNTLPNLDKLINLQELYCEYCNLSSLPNLNKLINLEYLVCNNNQLTELPPIDKLINLKHLICDENNITHLPDNIDKLINLKYLNIDNNKITHLPLSIRHCKKLDVYNSELDIPDYQYIDNLPYFINKDIEKYYYQPSIQHYADHLI
jgi:Leucine-rich repeat (LRR) protein